MGEVVAFKAKNQVKAPANYKTKVQIALMHMRALKLQQRPLVERGNLLVSFGHDLNISYKNLFGDDGAEKRIIFLAHLAKVYYTAASLNFNKFSKKSEPDFLQRTTDDAVSTVYAGCAYLNFYAQKPTLDLSDIKNASHRFYTIQCDCNKIFSFFTSYPDLIEVIELLCKGVGLADIS